jgi:hypothetical protein
MKTLALVVGLGLVAGCGGSGSHAAARPDTLTERQHDSILARSSVPGAGAVGAAMRAADTTSNHVRADTTQ